MHFRRWRLSNRRPFVNASLAMFVGFTIIACGKADNSASDAGNTAILEGTSLELPAVWETRALEGAVADMAISEGLSGLLAIAYEGGGFQLFNMESEPVGDQAPFEVKDLADGHTSVLDGTQLTVFPAVDESPRIKALVYGAGMVSPAIVNLPIEENERVVGICSGSAENEEAFRLAYWTQSESSVLKTGRISVVDSEFEWTPTEPVSSDAEISNCKFTASGAKAVSEYVDIAGLDRNDFSGDALLTASGQLVLQTGKALFTPNIRDGITIAAPKSIDAIAAVGAPLNGGYPGGVIIVAGPMEGGDIKAVFVDASPFTQNGSDGSSRPTE